MTSSIHVLPIDDDYEYIYFIGSGQCNLLDKTNIPSVRVHKSWQLNKLTILS